MPLPVLPLVIGGAGVALILAGSKEAGAKGVATPGVSVGSAPASTSGAGGGAALPSHADANANADAVTTIADPGPSQEGGEVNYNVRGIANEAMTATLEPVSDDPWAGTPGPSLDTKTVKASEGGALGAIATVGGLSGKAAADAFNTGFNSLFSIW